VNEESQIDEMRAALRGERERAEQARQRSTENVRALLDAPPPEAEPEARSERQGGLLSRLFGR
jgi:hypothetical protein